MNLRMLKSMAIAFVPAVATFALLQACGGNDANAQADGSDPIEGVWESVITARDCTSGAVTGTFRGMNMFHRGGTLTDTNGQPTTTRGPGFGLWAKTSAGYTASFKFFRFNTDGTLAGTQRVTRTLTLSADGNTQNATTSAQIFDLAGHVLQTLCVGDVSTRFR